MQSSLVNKSKYDRDLRVSFIDRETKVIVLVSLLMQSLNRQLVFVFSLVKELILVAQDIPQKSMGSAYVYFHRPVLGIDPAARTISLLVL